MKVIILISSIFYILGLKISNKIDLVKKVNPVEKIIMHSAKPENNENAVDFKEAEKEKEEAEQSEEKNKCESLE